MLVQHNCVLPLQTMNSDDDVVYKIEIDDILHRLRYPRFLLHVRECLGKTHELLLEGLLEHGRLRSHQLFARASATPGYDNHSNQGKTLEDIFGQLVEGRFVERVPIGYGSNQVSDSGGEAGQEGSQATEYKKTNDVQSRSTIHDDGNKLSAEVVGLGEEDDALWRVNANEFNRRFRHIACAALVREKVDQSAGHLLLTMLEISRGHEVKVDEERSTSVTEADIMQKLSGPGAPMQMKNMKSALEKLSADTSELISCIGNTHGGANYCVNMRRIIDLIRIKEIEAVVRERFGGPACRIFRLLLLKRNLEQKQIAEMAMIPVKDTRELLYKLLKAEYVQIQEVARTSDHAPSRTFYLWRVDLLRVVEQVGRDLYRATSNLRARLMHELSQEKETLMLLERAQDKSTIPLTTGQRQNLVRMRTKATRLEGAIMRIDELVLIFNVM